jgi:hypothetical protein
VLTNEGIGPAMQVAPNLRRHTEQLGQRQERDSGQWQDVHRRVQWHLREEALEPPPRQRGHHELSILHVVVRITADEGNADGRRSRRQ